MVAKPSFLFVGSSKSGSSWFFEILREHPRVFVPANKATFFFTEQYAKGKVWYETFFSQAKPGHVIGEVCHDYLASADALRRIKAYRPDMRMICCFRNPYERALSSWRFFGRNGMSQPTLAAQAARDPSVFEHGNYATHLRMLNSLFPRNQILVFLFEELYTDPADLARRLYAFIGVEDQLQPPSLHKRVNVNAKPRSQPMARLMHTIHQQSWKRSQRLSNLIGQIKRIRPLRWLVRAALYKEEIASTDWREQLHEFPDVVVTRYEAEITALEDALAKNLTDWRVPASRLRSAGRTRPE